MQLFGVSEGLELRVRRKFDSQRVMLRAHLSLQIKKRGSPPQGGGEVQFLCPIVKQVKTLNFVDPGKIKRIRGIS